MKILFIVKNMRIANGVTSCVMNYYNQLNKTNQIDFLVISDKGSIYYNEIQKNGSKIFLLPSYLKSPLKFLNVIKMIFNENDYDIVHSNVVNSASLILKYAKKFKVPVRILHSHATENGDSLFKRFRNFIFKSLSIYYSNCYFACSNLAGKALFGNREYKVIHNAINIEKYSFKEDLREEYREKYNVKNKLVLITVGRLTKQKNPFFIVDIIVELNSKNNDIVLWWFGNGKLENDIKKYAVKRGVREKIIFWGANDKVNEFYSAADIFILPSLYEGLPVVGIEAQISGLPAIFADTITQETKISAFVDFVSINNINEWCNSIEKYSKVKRFNVIKSLNTNEYEITNQAKRLEKIYQKLLSKDGGTYGNKEEYCNNDMDS